MDMVNLLIAEETKRCTRCRVRKPIAEFYTYNNRPISVCKECHNEYCAKHYREKIANWNPALPPLTPINHSEMLEKVCTICKICKPITEFSISKNGPHAKRVPSWCKLCRNERSRQWEANHPEQVKARYAKRRDQQKKRGKIYYRNNREVQLEKGRLRKYGMSAVEFENMIQAQDNCCAACGEPFAKTGIYKPAVHHDHITGFVLDILHLSCNTTEGLLRTSARAQRLADYMRKNEPTLFPKREVKIE